MSFSRTKLSRTPGCCKCLSSDIFSPWNLINPLISHGNADKYTGISHNPAFLRPITSRKRCFSSASSSSSQPSKHVLPATSRQSQKFDDRLIRSARSFESRVQLKKAIQASFEPLLYQLRKSAYSKRRFLFQRDADPSKPAVIGVPTAESYNLEDVVRACALYGFSATHIDEETKLALHVVDKEEEKEFFVFRDGVVLFWNVKQEGERIGILSWLADFSSLAYNTELMSQETEKLLFELNKDGKTRVKKGKILLNEKTHSGGQKYSDEAILERYALAHGLAMSVKLGVWEHNLDKLAEITEKVAEGMKKGKGKVTIKREDVLETIGQVQKLRYGINLGTDVISFVDVFWEREDLENLCADVNRCLDFTRREERMNKNLTYILEFLLLVEGLYSNKHSVRLERIIIALIGIEIVIGLIPFFKEYFMR